jgi:hypothetical protein
MRLFGFQKICGRGFIQADLKPDCLTLIATLSGENEFSHFYHEPWLAL